ncbi:hypothetical protein GGR54DRAFT_324818 [Hypoxylon sp. NC1633]|nr:hypothetical protein GGR54DRAFT_324818 [Hypoxylon sp. NC1633]
MAAMAAQQSPIGPSGSSGNGSRDDGRTTETSERGLSVPSRNPLPLSASQEAQVREVFNERVRKLCADEIKGGFPSPFSLFSFSHSFLLSCSALCLHPSLDTFPDTFLLARKESRAVIRGGQVMEAKLTKSHRSKTAFADCARNRTFTIPFACREASRGMNSCMLAHATPAEHDRAREQWFAQRQLRAREREHKERRKLEQEAFHREWWGLPQRDPEDVRKELHKLERGERVGGMTSRRPLQVPPSRPPPGDKGEDGGKR